MTTETAAEWYQFTCTSCSARWITCYEARHVIDDAGQTRSFYWHSGLPCEAPSAAVTACPACGRPAARAELFDRAPAGAAAGQADPVSPDRPGQPGRPHRHGKSRHHEKTASYKPFKFTAVISLDATGQHQPAGPYPSGIHSLMVRASSPDDPGLHEYFPAVIYTSDEQPLRPGDLFITVTIVVTDEDAPEYFWSGRRFALWDGGDIGHGTVSRQVFNWPELARRDSG